MTARRLIVGLVAFFILTLNVAAEPWRQYGNPTREGYDLASLAKTRALAEQAQSAAVFATKNGNVLVAWGAVDQKFELHSVRKSIYAALWGIAESKGLVKLDATLESLGVDDLQPLTAAEKQARLIDLLHARSGVYHPSAYAPTDMEEGLPKRGSHAPNTFWYYNNWDFNVAGSLLERVGGKPLGQLLDEWIAKPIGMEDYRPEDVFAVREPGVSRWPALTIRMSARDLARFGQLWLNEGRWGQRQIIPAAFVARASASKSETGLPGQGYGMMWWTYEPGSMDAAKYPNASKVRIVIGRGTGGQAVVVIPDRDLVFVHRADTDHGRGTRGGDVWAILDGLLGAESKPLHARTDLGALRAEPFANALPPMEFPATIALDRARMDALAGEYTFAPGMTARIFVHEGRLFAFMPGKGEAELFATSPRDFYVRVDPTSRIRFDEAEGRITAVRVTMRGKEMIGRRVAPESVVGSQ
jgi:CubicO group peptidase (beta-lactamase class C family)